MITTNIHSSSQNRLIRCKSCGRDVIFARGVCPKCGSVRKKTGSGCLKYFLIITFIAFASIILPVIVILSSEHSKKQNADTDTIPYKVVREWHVNEGRCQVIIVAPEQVSQSKLRRLGEQLHQERQNDKRAFVYIYSDERAARLREEHSKLSATDEAFHDNNFIGEYSKNSPMNHEEYSYYPFGVRAKDDFYQIKW